MLEISKKQKTIISFGLMILLSSFLVLILKNDHPKQVNNKSISHSSSFPENSSYIPVAFSTDDNYVYPTIVSVTSILENANKDTYYKIYILVPEKLSSDKYKKLLLVEDYYDNCDINIINMHNAFENSEKKSWGTAMYYRLRLPSILLDESKCIYLDGDTIVKKDLSELYNINLEDYYVGGVADDRRVARKDYAEKIGIESMDQYICSGVLIWNLDKMRKDNVESRFNEFIDAKVNKEKVSECPDQDAINAVCFNSILDIPFKFDVMLNMDLGKAYEENNIAKVCFSYDEWQEGINDPTVIHYTLVKPWKNRSSHFYEDWWMYAEKSVCTQDIKNIYKYISN